MQKNCFSYPVEFVEDVFGDSPVLAETLKKASGSDEPKVLIVADANVVQRTEGLGTKIGRYVQAHGIRLSGSPVVLSGGEKVKSDSLQSAMKVFAAILSGRLGRNDIVLALGGGTILDVAGYAAAQVRGGVKLVRLPTTPAAMLDAAYADYAAADSASVKDALRVPSIPAAVVTDTRFAASVLDGVWRGGLGEAVRLAVAGDAALMKTIVKLLPAYCERDMKALSEMVAAVYASRKKHAATSFGLWSAFRLEAMSGYKLPHGYAVSIGLCVELCCAVEQGVMKAADRDGVIALMRSSGALDGLAHSVHLLQQGDDLLQGLDDWSLSIGRPEVVLPKGVGKPTEALADREALRRAFKTIAALPAQA